MELNDLYVIVSCLLSNYRFKKFHHIHIVLRFRVFLNALSFYLNKWSELNLIEKDELPKFFWLVVEKCGLVCCNFLLLEWIKILSQVRKGYVELFRFLNQIKIGDFRSFFVYDSTQLGFFSYKHLKLIPLKLLIQRDLYT